MTLKSYAWLKIPAAVWNQSCQAEDWTSGNDESGARLVISLTCWCRWHFMYMLCCSGWNSRCLHLVWTLHWNRRWRVSGNGYNCFSIYAKLWGAYRMDQSISFLAEAGQVCVSSFLTRLDNDGKCHRVSDCLNSMYFNHCLSIHASFIYRSVFGHCDVICCILKTILESRCQFRTPISYMRAIVM